MSKNHFNYDSFFIEATFSEMEKTKAKQIAAGIVNFI